MHTLGVAHVAEAGDVDDDQLGVDFPEEFVGDALASPHRPLGGFDEDIGILNQGADDFLALVGEGVHGDGALVAAFHFLDVLGVANGVTGVGVLNPRDVCAPFGHDFACGGDGDFHGGVDDLEAVKVAV